MSFTLRFFAHPYRMLSEWHLLAGIAPACGLPGSSWWSECRAIGLKGKCTDSGREASSAFGTARPTLLLT